ncbi:MAG: zinc ribbon domain-containing protein [Armatimonadota bacterium]|nr:zinc ribbon domain-containing protein [Armatimonadota bacterium]
MPTYEYLCKACEHQFEVFQRVTEPPVTECVKCGGPVRKLISPVGVIFKGPGFHVNDYRKPEAKKDEESSSKTEKASSESKTPAATAAS